MGADNIRPAPAGTPLTIGQIRELVCNYLPGQTLVDFVRSVEKAHGIDPAKRPLFTGDEAETLKGVLAHVEAVSQARTPWPRLEFSTQTWGLIARALRIAGVTP